MPLNFVEFWNLIRTRKETKETNVALAQLPQGIRNMSQTKNSESLHEIYKWKLKFKSFCSHLPAFYNDSMNRLLKFLKCDPALFLKPSD